MPIRPGDVVIVEFPGVRETKRRPAVVVSSPIYHKVRPDALVGLITGRTEELTVTDCLLRDWAQAGLRRPSVFRTFLTTFPVSSLKSAGRLSEADWEAVQACLGKALALAPESS